MAAIVVATAPSAGSDTLLWRPVAGRPLVAWPLRALAALDDLGYCALVTPLARHEEAASVLQREAPARINVVIPTAAPTWREALASVEGIPTSCAWIIALDAAQPFVTAASLRAGLRAATQTGVAMAGEPVKETLKRVEGNVVRGTPPRDMLRRLLTPAIFRREALRRALEAHAASEPLRGDAGGLVALAQSSGAPFVVFDAGYLGAHVTSDADLAIVETLLTQRQSENHPV